MTPGKALTDLRAGLGDPATDPVGLSRRLRRLDDVDGDTLRQALEDAIGLRVGIAAAPCRDCETHPALLCPIHAAELDWVSLYRTLARDLCLVLRSK